MAVLYVGPQQVEERLLSYDAESVVTPQGLDE